MNFVKKSLVVIVPLGLCLLAYHAMLDSFAEPQAPAKPAAKSAYPAKVPADQLKKTQAMKSTLPINTNLLAMGKTIYEGKGTCIGCHGAGGKGDGELSVSLDTPPRNFTDRKWQEARTDGEIFWIISNGTETGMISFQGMLSDSEIWALTGYVRSFGK